ncbi:hypothetical protein SELMODRAFT_422715 [Selaginella moellendorffii]|uniref:Uncharacterized protein n=1 Tax=Selaginella moellendorffii TaxID=88036 RepID=D8SJB2_SELML|nr:uncharacterized protein LOC9655080 [Selaginella moellendorffii]EFJ15422.1 hypothetical protein SELMODRAFT_422715 [Selaginella moellendorffii]|eukprot:XP_002983521.1 uncharacterized protein LOC9655080 [Selaginella moellendorffii]
MEGNEEEMITLSTEVSHKFWIVSYAADGSRRCHGGDFYEIDLSGHQWKSRPSVTDLGDGSYLVELKVDGEFTGIYTLRAILLYSNFHGMDHSATEWAVDKEVFRLQIHFTSSTGGSTRTTLPLCTSSDFTSKKPWLGKWTRTKFDESCALDEDGRYLCLRDDEQCDESQCSGALERLESNGWVYSAHCKFRIWSTTEAWKCLDGKKLFFWGDSNHRDTIRNLLNLVLGMNETIEQRSIIINVTNPANPAQKLRVFQIYNGAPDPGKVFLGLRSLDEPAYLELVKKEFFQGGVPDAVILNSGLHDGHAWKNPREFATAAKTAALFWKSLLRESNKARVVFRNTVAVAGSIRANPSNPQKMEAFNSILSDEFQRQFRALENLVMFVDNYDMTFPWHYDHCCSDGGHYGVAPSLSPWFGTIGHYYFVDLMLIHVLLTTICS